MSTGPEEPEDLASLYRRAFAEYGHALWNLHPVKLPTPSDALAITQALRIHGHMEGRRLAERTEDLSRRDETVQLEWVTDVAFRFFSTQPDELFGYVLHPVDLASNKASAAADRRVPRDIVDLVTVHENILPLGAVLSTAVGKFPALHRRRC
jgi:hypothetical protein